MKPEEVKDSYCGAIYRLWLKDSQLLVTNFGVSLFCWLHVSVLDPEFPFVTFAFLFIVYEKGSSEDLPGCQFSFT